MKLKTVFCCLFVTLACLFINSTSARDQQPLTWDNKPFLDLCWEPYSSVWRRVPITKAGEAHCRVENIVISAFRKAWLVHEPIHLSRALVNSPLSGKSVKRGRNLLSFSAFNGFRRLALWGAINGSNVNQGDADTQTMLSTAIADRESYMVDFGLFHLKANPNTVYGEEPDQVTALWDMVHHAWPVDALEKMIKSGAVVRNQTEFEIIQDYFIQIAGSNWKLQLKARELMHTLYLAGSLVNPDTTGKPVTIYTDMLTEIDRHILYAIEHGELTRGDMDLFWIHGRNFYQFLAFNGFSQTLKYLFHYRIALEKSSKLVHKRDNFGFDMLLAAIHSNDADTVTEVLRVSRLAINQKVPSFRDFKNQGQKPLDLARKWQASPEVIKVLLENGATPLIQ